MKKITFLLLSFLLLNISFFGCSNSSKSTKKNEAKKSNIIFNKNQQITSDLFNFRIEDNEPTKIYFDSKKKIDTVLIENFSIKDHDGVKILSSTINKSTKNHFLIVEKSLSWYHNNTISYLGDKNIEAFNLQFVKNNISIPKVTGKQYYVNATIENSGDGLTEVTAFKTIQEGVNILVSGDKLWIKSGNYGNENIVIKRSGTTTQPIQIEGYIKTLGDIDKMYYTYEDSEAKLNAKKMPMLDGGNRGKGIGFMLSNQVHHIIIKNLQITNYHQGFFGRVNTGKVRLERVLVKDIGDWENGGKEGSGILLETWDDNKCNYYRVKECIVINAEERGITSMGDNNYYENCKVYSNEFNLNEKDYMKKATDYYYRLQGVGNIIRGCEAHKKTALGHNGHAFSMKYFNEYNLVENCKAINIQWSYQARHSVCRFNVFRNSEANADVSYRRRGQYDSYTGGINVMCGANHNTFDNIYIHDTDLAFDFYKNIEDNENSRDIGHDNIFKNILIENIVHTVIHIRNYEEEHFESSFNNNKFYNLTINKVNFQETPVVEYENDEGAIQGAFFEWNPKGNITAEGNEIINCNIKKVSKLNIFEHFPMPEGFIWKNINFEEAFSLPPAMLKK